MKTIVKEITVGYSFKPEMGCFGFSSCLLVESNKRILFDVGGYNIRSLIKPLINEIDCVVISHLHFDHCSNLDLFVDTNIPIYISRKELDYYEKYNEKGLEILDFPCNQFGNQAPGSDEEIHEFCTLKYNTKFDQFKKVDVNCSLFGFLAFCNVRNFDIAFNASSTPCK